MTWRDADPDLRTRTELDVLLASADADDAGDDDRGDAAAARADLAARFSGLLEFGTAGLRGAIGAGPHRMNRAVVILAAAGLAAYLREKVTGTPRVVVGYDARTDSDLYARDTCAVLTAAGVCALVLPRPLPTPVLAYALLRLDADAGVVVTASHNPPQDNGYKVYLGGRVEPGAGKGAQIVPPADTEIAAQIAAAGAAMDVPLAEHGWQRLDDGIVEEYLEAVRGVLDPGGPRDLSVVLTPLHGVGGEIAARALAGAGFPEPYVVPQQAAPDPAFPTVPFPNPEEPGAIDLAIAAATRRGADLVIANDPDADRCAVAVPDPAVRDPAGGPAWRMLRGDEVGALLGEYLLSRADGPARADGQAPGLVTACSIVSSQLLGRIAAAHGATHTETLTGFKWISRVPGLYYGYEEALGYCVAPGLVRDKDGISAALLVAELAAGLRARGRSLLDALDALAVAHGVHATDQLSFRVADLCVIADAMARLRARPPERLAGAPVVSVEDLLRPTNGLPPTDGVRYRTDAGVRVVIRPSGTEPKLKCYLEAVVPVGPSGLAAARQRARTTLTAVRRDLSSMLHLSGLVPSNKMFAEP